MRVQPDLRNPHALNETERRLVHTLLMGATAAERNAIMDQANAATVHWVEARGQPMLVFEVPDTVPAHGIQYGVVAEGEAPDRDGVRIHFLLHLTSGYLTEIEIYREDGDAIIEFPSMAALTVS